LKFIFGGVYFTRVNFLAIAYSLSSAFCFQDGAEMLDCFCIVKMATLTKFYLMAESFLIQAFCDTFPTFFYAVFFVFLGGGGLAFVVTHGVFHKTGPGGEIKREIALPRDIALNP